MSRPWTLSAEAHRVRGGRVWFRQAPPPCTGDRRLAKLCGRCQERRTWGFLIDTALSVAQPPAGPGSLLLNYGRRISHPTMRNPRRESVAGGFSQVWTEVSILGGSQTVDQVRPGTKSNWKSTDSPGRRRSTQRYSLPQAVARPAPPPPVGQRGLLRRAGLIVVLHRGAVQPAPGPARPAQADSYAQR
jgi:hypothetical protein